MFSTESSDRIPLLLSSSSLSLPESYFKKVVSIYFPGMICGYSLLYARCCNLNDKSFKKLETYIDRRVLAKK